MTSLRKRFFPPHLNKLDAHVAIFRALPGSEMEVILKDLTSVTYSTSAFTIRTREVLRLSKGVAVNIEDGGHSRAIYETLKKSWDGFLSKQDRSYRPHYTVANKLDGEQDVQDCLEGMHEDFQGSEGTVEGLALYRYERGRWVDRKIFWLQGGQTRRVNSQT
jgi:2'-5' RNA ligase